MASALERRVHERDVKRIPDDAPQRSGHPQFAPGSFRRRFVINFRVRQAGGRVTSKRGLSRTSERGIVRVHKFVRGPVAGSGFPQSAARLLAMIVGRSDRLLLEPLRGDESFQPARTHRLRLLEQRIGAADGAEVSAFDAEYLIVPMALGQS